MYFQIRTIQLVGLTDDGAMQAVRIETNTTSVRVGSTSPMGKRIVLTRIELLRGGDNVQTESQKATRNQVIVESATQPDEEQVGAALIDRHTQLGLCHLGKRRAARCALGLLGSNTAAAA